MYSESGCQRRRIDALERLLKELESDEWLEILWHRSLTRESEHLTRPRQEAGIWGGRRSWSERATELFRCTQPAQQRDQDQAGAAHRLCTSQARPCGGWQRPSIGLRRGGRRSGWARGGPLTSWPGVLRSCMLVVGCASGSLGVPCLKGQLSCRSVHCHAHHRALEPLRSKPLASHRTADPGKHYARHEHLFFHL